MGGLGVALAGGGDGLGFEEVVDAVADHVFDLLLLADHGRGVEEGSVVHLAHLFLQSFGVVGFGAGGEGVEGGIQQKIIIQIVIF